MTVATFLAWGICMALACGGYGRVALSALGIRHRESLILAPGTGLAILVFTGSILNLLRMVTRPIVIADIAAGAALYFSSILFDSNTLTRRIGQLGCLRPMRPVQATVLAFLVLTLCLRVGAHVRFNPMSFNFRDDAQAYLAFPLKMLASGSYAPDPYSERRIQTTLGGITFLQATAIAPTGDLRIVNLVDGSIGLALLFLCGVALCRRLKLSLNRSLWVLAVLVLTPDIRVNSTSLDLPAALLLLMTLIWLDLELGEPLGWRRMLLLGLTAGTACTLKSTIIPSAAVLTAALLLTELGRSGARRIVSGAAVATAAVCAVDLPWMIDSWGKCGTPLYPLLGAGYIRPLLHQDPIGRAPTWLASALLPSLAGAGAAIVLWRQAARDGNRGRQVGTAAACMLTAVPLLVGFAIREDVVRYSLSCIWASHVLVVAFLLSQPSRAGRATNWTGVLFTGYALAFASVVHGFYPLSWGGNEEYWLGLFKMNIVNRSQRVPEAAHAAEDQAMQEAIPAGATLLARTSESYGYDFKRNTVWIADYPGTAGPPPGMPLEGDPDKLSAYLLEHSVRYVAYSYGDEARLSVSECVKLTSPSRQALKPWETKEAKVSCIIQRDLAQLGKTRRRLFDDGHTFLLDLKAPAR